MIDCVGVNVLNENELKAFCKAKFNGDIAGGVDETPIGGIVKGINGVTDTEGGAVDSDGVGVAANCADVGSGGGVGMIDVSTTGAGVDVGTTGAGVDVVTTGVGAVVGAGVGAGVGVGVGAGVGVGNTVEVPKGRVAKDATPVAGVAVAPAVANGVVDSALPLGSFPNNLINTVLSSDSPNVSLDFCNLGILFCT